MTKKLLIKLALVAIVMFVGSFDAVAKWEFVQQITSPYCMTTTSKGTILVANYVFDGTGGIYRSDDQGATWTKTDAPDYTYGKILDAGDYIIATGRSCRVARSNDDGKTWEVTSYASAITTQTAAELDQTISYAAAMHNGRLYVGDFCGAGVLYTTDFGETWHRTDVPSMQYQLGSRKPSNVTENIYNLASYNGELYAFGVYYIFKYDEANDVWVTLRDDSNFMSVSTVFNGMLVCGRTVMNQNTEVPYLLTFDGTNWGEIARPEGLADNNTRCITSDDKAIYVGMQHNGFYCTFNGGESWVAMSDGLPSMIGGNEGEIQHLLNVTNDDTYVYIIVYDEPFDESGIDGVYRITKAELEALHAASAIDIEADELNVRFDGSYLYVGECTAMTISDLSGRTIDLAVVDGKVDLQSLTTGVYMYSVVNGDKKVAGKFIK